MLLALLLLSGTSDLDHILNSPDLRGARVAACVQTLDGRTIFSRHANYHMIPGSNEKLISNAYALYKLGPTFRPQTRIWVELEGTVIDAPGDPMMTDTQLADAAKTLGMAHDVRVREAYHPGYHPDWEFGDLWNRYAAPVTSFAFNQGGFEMWAEHGKPMLLPKAFGVEVAVKPSNRGPRVIYDPIRKKATVVGRLPDKKTRLDTLSIPEPDRAAASYFGSTFELVNEVPTTPPSLTIEGKSMAEMLAACLKPSDNIMAENLLLMAATKDGPLDDPYRAADLDATKFLTSVIGADPSDIRVADGSGLSRHNVVTPRELAKLLRWADRQPTTAIWHAAMAYPGQGTLKKRLIGIPFHGKTGTLDMVVALSGYVRGKSGATVVVSVIVNGFSGSADSVRGIVDSFIRRLATR